MTARLPLPSSLMNRKEIFLFSSGDIVSSLWPPGFFARQPRARMTKVEAA
jgi:hypothetical protein